MVADDACSVVKSDLKGGTWIRYTDGPPPLYRENADKFKGGPIYIRLLEPRREPNQDFTGTIIYTRGGCIILAMAPSDTIRDNLYLDVIDILNATDRGYLFDFSSDLTTSIKRLSNSIEVSLFI